MTKSPFFKGVFLTSPKVQIGAFPVFVHTHSARQNPTWTTHRAKTYAS